MRGAHYAEKKNQNFQLSYKLSNSATDLRTDNLQYNDKTDTAQRYLGFQIPVQNPFIVDVVCGSTHLSKPSQDLKYKKEKSKWNKV